jgi:hypothetical protein
MADNVETATGSGGFVFGADEIIAGGATVYYPRGKLVWGPDGTVVDASTSQPLPVQLRTSTGGEHGISSAPTSVTVTGGLVATVTGMPANTVVTVTGMPTAVTVTGAVVATVTAMPANTVVTVTGMPTAVTVTGSLVATVTAMPANVVVTVTGVPSSQVVTVTGMPTAVTVTGNVAVTGRVSLVGTTTGGLTTFRLTTAATTNINVVKAGEAMLYGVQVFNINANAGYLKIFNLATTPDLGTVTVAHMNLLVPGATGGGGVALTWPVGVQFATGISIAFTGNMTVTDTTAVSAEEATINLQYV